jgi:lysozyme family protein
VSNFDRFIDRVLDHEGGYVNDPRDPGGETKYGISKRSYPHVDIANLTRDEAKAIYKRDFWNRIQGERLPAPVAFFALDFAVNSGHGTAIRKLQAAAGVADDGMIGPVSLTAINAADMVGLLMRYAAERIDFLRKLSKFKDFGGGWMARVATNLRHAATDVEALA